MAKTLTELAANLRTVNEQLKQAASDLAVEVAETVLADLTVKTPVDTTKAISNWQIALNAPAEGYLDPYYPGKQGSTWTQSAQAAYDAGKKVLLNKKPGDTIHLTNNAPYIVRLNDGYSQQAPAGFVERSALLGSKVIKKAKFKIKV